MYTKVSQHKLKAWFVATPVKIIKSLSLKIEEKKIKRFNLYFIYKEQAFSQRGVRVSFGHPIAPFWTHPDIHIFFVYNAMGWKGFGHPNSSQMCIFGHPILKCWLKPWQGKDTEKIHAYTCVDYAKKGEGGCLLVNLNRHNDYQAITKSFKLKKNDNLQLDKNHKILIIQ